MTARRIRCVARQVTIVAFLVTLAVSSVSGERVPLPRGVFYYRPAASVFGAEAAWVNPAAFGRYRASGFQVMAEYTDETDLRSWGTVFNREQLAVAWRHIHQADGGNFRECIFASGMSLGKKLQFGGSYRYFQQGPGIYHKRHFWNIGVSGERRTIRWAAVFSNLNHGRVDGRKTEAEQRYSISWRPVGKLITLSADMFLSTKMKLSHADYVYHLEAKPYRGLVVEASLDTEENFQVGVRLNFTRRFFGGQSTFDRDAHHKRTTVYTGASSLKQHSLISSRQRKLAVDLSGRVRENPPRPFFGRRDMSLISLLTTLYRAADDPMVAGMVVRLRNLALDFAQAQELRQALKFFSSHNKPVVCHLSYPGNIDYFVASVADTILLSPVSQLNLVGLKAELSFYAGTLDKLGIKAEIERIGDYKTAPELYTRQAASEPNRRQINRILDDIFDQFVGAIAAGRSLAPDSVRSLIDEGPFTSKQAVENGLADGLSYRDDVSRSFLAAMPEISFRRYVKDTLVNDGWPPVPVLGLVVAEGEITGDGGGRFPFGAGERVTPAAMKQSFTRVADLPQVKGIIFRINSPGGLALAGEEIYHFAHKTAQRKPLVISMSGVAASGGYYIAVSGVHIFASPGTITGSIGIYGGKADLSGLYEKIGVGKELFTRGRYAGMLSMVRPFTPDERAKYRSQLQAFYDHFVRLVGDGRGLSSDSVETLARGRVFTGREAVANGLVDELGGLQQSLQFTADRLGLRDYRLAVYPEKRRWLVWPGQSLLSAVVRFFSGKADVEETLTDGLGLDAQGGILARMPFDITID